MKLSLRDRRNVLIESEPLTHSVEWLLVGEHVVYIGTIIACFTREECEADPYLSNHQEIVELLYELDRGGE